MGDLNAKVGEQKSEEEKSIGKFGHGKRNERGETLVDFAISNNLRIMNTTFPLHQRRLYTWTSPLDGSKHQLDYIMIEQQHSELITAVRTFPGADCGSDHELLMAEIKLKVKKRKKKNAPVKFNVEGIPAEYTIAAKTDFRY